MAGSSVLYRERLRAPLSWWAFAAFMIASVFVAMDVAGGFRLSLPVTLVTAALCVVGLLRVSRAEVVVGPDGLQAGRATLPLWACGQVEVLDAAAARRARGAEADPRVFDLQRPWVPTAVRVAVSDPQDPTPSWLVSTRRPRRLAEALEQARSRDGTGP